MDKDTLYTVAVVDTSKGATITVPGRGDFAILRLYGPTEPALTKTWKPGELTKTSDFFTRVNRVATGAV